MTTEEKIAYIHERVGQAELFAQVAEEAAELTQAALKLRRALTGANPTPRSVDACYDDLNEEMEDTLTAMGAALCLEGVEYTDRQIAKIDRWYNRLKEAEKNG